METSIVSYYTARPSRDLVIAARQEITHEVWPILQKQFKLYISALVIQEASHGDKEAAKKRLSALYGIPVLEISQETQDIAQTLISDNTIPPEYEKDALHIAVASINGIDFLLTWNFCHINNAFTRSKIVKSIEKQGYAPPEICSPEELLGD
ncbi:MAG: type II toxin-antitoxin system VapC family toxin [Candidatus Anammoxibacter sp.]